MDGIVFGIIDNFVVIIGAMYGLTLDRFFSGRGTGGVVGAGLGNALSDLLAGLGEGKPMFALGTFIGCVLALVLIPFFKVVVPAIKRKIWNH